MGVFSVVQELKEFDKELVKKGSSLEQVIKSLLGFGGELPIIFKRLEDMENLISKLEEIDDITASLKRIENKLEIK